jgi:DNA-binding LytR/AlgR family response regulator
MNKSIAIVEDDVFVARDLEELLGELGYIVSFVAHSAGDAIHKIKDKKPELVLMDIQLNDAIDGVHLAGIFKTEYKIPVIFTTAFSDAKTLERVKNVSPFGYIIKPYAEANIRVAVELAFTRISEEKAKGDLNTDDYCFINSVNGMIKIATEDILYIEAFDYYSNVFTATEKILAKMTLKEVLDALNNKDLLRIHKSYAVNVRHVTKIKYNEVYIGAVKIPIGRAYKDEVMQKLHIV